MLTFIIPTLNRADLLAKTINSVHRHTPYPHKIIIINNGTNHDVAYLVNDEAKKGAIALNFPKNAGVARSWNIGIHMAYDKLGSHYAVVINDDVELHEDINKCVDVADSANPSLIKMCDYACFMILRKAISRVGYFDEAYWPAYYEDIDYENRLVIAGICSIHLPFNLTHVVNGTRKGGIDIDTNRSGKHYLAKWGSYDPAPAHKYPCNNPSMIYVPFNKSCASV